MRAVGFDLRRDCCSAAQREPQLIQLHDTCRRFRHPAFRKIEPPALDEDAGNQPVPAACVTQGLRLIEQRIGLLGVGARDSDPHQHAIGDQGAIEQDRQVDHRHEIDQ